MPSSAPGRKICDNHISGTPNCAISPLRVAVWYDIAALIGAGRCTASVGTVGCPEPLGKLTGVARGVRCPGMGRATSWAGLYQYTNTNTPIAPLALTWLPSRVSREPGIIAPTPAATASEKTVRNTKY